MLVERGILVSDADLSRGRPLTDGHFFAVPESQHTIEAVPLSSTVCCVPGHLTLCKCQGDGAGNLCHLNHNSP